MDRSHLERPTAPLHQRLWAASVIGAASGLLAFVLHRRPGFWPDFVYPWAAARHLLAGRDPYLALPGGLGDPFNTPLLYPLPTALAVVPVASLPLPVAGGIIMAISAALLAFAISRNGLDRLWMLASGPFVMALNLGQWSPLVTVAALVPAWGWLAALKPNIGLAALAYRPSWAAVVGCALVGVVSVIVLPAWPLEWLHAIRSLPGHPAPILSMGGAGLVLLLAGLRWQTPEGRLLLIMACVPQLLFFADQLPVFLVARTKREIQLLSGSSLLAFLLWYWRLQQGDLYVLAATPFVLTLIYLPALVLVLRRPNSVEAVKG